MVVADTVVVVGVVVLVVIVGVVVAVVVVAAGVAVVVGVGATAVVVVACVSPVVVGAVHNVRVTMSRSTCLTRVFVAPTDHMRSTSPSPIEMSFRSPVSRLRE